MKSLTAFAILTFILASCTKVEDVTTSNCLKGRFVTSGCWPVIELLEPMDGRLPTARYGTIEHSFGIENLPEKYKNGVPFYFTVRRIDSNKKYLTYCVPTKYFIEIESYSDTPCDQRNKTGYLQGKLLSPTLHKIGNHVAVSLLLDESVLPPDGRWVPLHLHL